MDIILLILHADPARGGAERYTLDLAGALVQRGHRVALGARSFAQVPPGVERVNLDAGGATRIGQYRRFLNAIDTHLASRRYDVVHAMLPVRQCDVYHPHAGIAAEVTQSGSLFKRLRNAANARRRAFAAVEQRLLSANSPPVVLCLSEIIKQTVRRHYPLGDDRLAMLFNAVDLERFNPAEHFEAGQALRRQYGISPETPLAAMIAQDFHRKGLEQALRAIAMDNKGAGQRPRMALIVAGRPNPAPFQQLAGKLGVDNQVIFAGPVADPRPIYAGADMLVLPTRHDPCSLVVLEALAMELPVITTRCNGASEIMVSGRHGIVLDDPDDIAPLAEAMRRLADPEQREKMRQACRDLRPRLAAQTHLDRLMGIYGTIAAAGRCDRPASVAKRGHSGI